MPRRAGARMGTMGTRAARAARAGLALLIGGPAAAALSDSIRNHDGTPGRPPPALLSGTGLYADIASPSRKIAEGILPFRVNAPLWSDGAAKERFISLPPGGAVVPTDTDGYAYPEGTVFIKNFRVDTVYGDSSSRILVETRFLVRHAGPDPEANPWHGIAYRWRRDQTDAALADTDFGENGVINVRKGGSLRGMRWTWPSRHQCNTCHFGRGILGFITPQLNLPLPDGRNQLQALADAGALSRNPIAARPAAFRWRALDDTSAPREVRMRSWFAANCSHCHGNGPSPGDHVFDYYHPEVSIDQGPEGRNGAWLDKRTGQGGDAFPRFAYKGWPESSYVAKRMLVRQDFGFTPTEQMPTLATFLPDSGALRLLREWLCAFGTRPASACRLPDVQDDASYWDAPAAIHAPSRPGRRGSAPRIESGVLLMEPGNHATPRLRDLRGRRLPLRPAGAGRYRLPGGLPAGILFLETRAGTAVLRHLP